MASVGKEIGHAMERQAFSVLVDRMYSGIAKSTDRTRTFLQLVDAAGKFYGKAATPETLELVRSAFRDPDNRWVRFLNKIIDESNPKFAKKMLLNLGYEAFFRGTKLIRKNREIYNCNIPWLILFDPTSACNMHCIGCWSGTYGHKSSLTFEDMDKIVTEGKELGVYLYMMTGGEPMVRKKDVLRLCEKHSDCFFAAYTNSTLIDEELCQKVV